MITQETTERAIAIYGLKDPRDGQIKYVGQTQDMGSRLALHISEARSRMSDTAKSIWIRDLMRDGALPEMVLLEETTTQESAEKERAWIRKIGAHGKLRNRNGGGNVKRKTPRNEGNTISFRITKELRERLASAAARASAKIAGIKICLSPMAAGLMERGLKIEEAEAAASQSDPPKPRRR